MTSSEIQLPTRVNGSFIETLERPLVASMVGFVPESLGPDAFTLIGLFGSFIAFTAYCLTQWNASFLWLASFGIVVNWFGDSLDGTIARMRKQERPRYGFFVDHTSDFVSQLLIGFGLGISPFVRFDVACVALIGYLVLAAFSFVRGNASGTLPIAFARIGPTEVRCTIILLNTLLLFYRPPVIFILHGAFSVADLAILGGGIGALAVFVVLAWQETLKLADEDPPPGSRLKSSLARSKPSPP